MGLDKIKDSYKGNAQYNYTALA